MLSRRSAGWMLVEIKVFIVLIFGNQVWVWNGKQDSRQDIPMGHRGGG